jgi:hypothetical protein
MVRAGRWPGSFFRKLKKSIFFFPHGVYNEVDIQKWGVLPHKREMPAVCAGKG